MRGIIDLLASERGVWCVIVFLTATAMMLIGRIDSPAWVDAIKFLTMVLVASKTVTTSLEARRPQVPTATVVSAPDKG